jgi:hypothetical protein
MGGRPSFVMLSAALEAIRLGAQRDGWLLFMCGPGMHTLPAGDGTWAGCCMCCELGDEAGSTRRGSVRACARSSLSCGCFCLQIQSNPIHAAARLGRPLVSLTPAEDSPELRPDPAQVAMAVRVDLPT